jgi:hypothetical protein
VIVATAYHQVTMENHLCERHSMKKLTALAVVTLASQAVVTFAGPPSPKEVIPTPPPPPEYFRPNEWDIGAFATYATGTGGGPTGTRIRDGFTTTLSGDTSLSGWGGGMDFTYFFPWKYAGIRFQGAGVSLSSGTFTVTETVTGPNGRRTATASRSGSVDGAAGIITSDIILRLPLDDFWSGVHLAPYGFVGFGALFGGGGGQTINTRFPELNDRFNSINRGVQSRVLGNVGGGFEYRFTPHIGIFGEAGYNFIDHTRGKIDANFIQTNFGLRYAF